MLYRLSVERLCSSSCEAVESQVLFATGRDEGGEVAGEVGGLELSRGVGVSYAKTGTGESLELVDGVHDVRNVRLEDHATHDDLIEDVMHLVRVEDQIQLANVLEAAI